MGKYEIPVWVFGHPQYFVKPAYDLGVGFVGTSAGWTPIPVLYLCATLMKTGPECILEGKFNRIENVYEVDHRKYLP